MDLIGLVRVASDERRSFKFLLERMAVLRCLSCSCGEIYVMSRVRLRCVACRKDFRPLNGTWFSEVKIPCSKWLVLMKLFELSTSARKAAEEVKVSYKTALKAFSVIRRAIAHELARGDEILRGEIKADESYFGGRRMGKRGEEAGVR